MPDEFCRFPERWDVLPFTKAVKDATSGNVKIQKSLYQDKGAIPVVDQGQTLYGGFTDDEQAICRSGSPAIVFGDHTRAFKFIEEPFALGADGAKVLEPLVDLDKRFLFHYLKQLRIEAAGYSRHYKFLKETYVPVPPLAEQKRIAAILDKADAIRRKRQQAIQLADEFLRSVFLDMFGDPVTNPKGWPLQTISSLVQKPITYGILKPEEHVDSGVPMLRIQDVKGGKVNEVGLHKVSSALSTQYKRTILQGGEIVISLVGTLGMTAIIPESLNGANVHRNLGVISISDATIKCYLASLMKMPHFSVFIERVTKGGVHKLLNLADLNEMKVPLPPKNIIEKYLSIAGLLETNSTSLVIFNNEVENIFSSLSQKAFSGQL